MNKFEDIRGVAFDLDGMLVDSAPGLAAAVDMALYALELPVAGEERVITWIGNGADIPMERALTWARQERATLRKTMGKPPVDDDIPAEEQVRILRKLFDRYYGEVAEEGRFVPRMLPIRWARCRLKACRWAWSPTNRRRSSRRCSKP